MISTFSNKTFGIAHHTNSFELIRFRCGIISWDVFLNFGTLYTVLAGMLNMLVIYDAWAGPMHPFVKEEKSRVNLDKENKDDTAA